MSTEKEHQGASNVDSPELYLDDEMDFSSQYTENFPGILTSLNISLAATSYDSSRLIILRTQDNKLNTQLEFFHRPMGLYIDESTFVIGTLNNVINFKRTDFFLPQIQSGGFDNLNTFSRKLQEKKPELLNDYLKNRDEKLVELKQANALYSERACLTTGRINIHDIAWGSDRLWILNTAFSSLCSLDPDYNFIAHWKPSFISELRPEDRCHLNGLAMRDGMPKYVTVCGQENSKDAWYNRELNGAIIDIESNEILVSGLYMPHSPKVHGDYLYFCESGLACIKRIHLETLKVEVFAELPSFGRGLCFYGDLMFLGLSVVRDSENVSDMPIRQKIKEEDSFCGIWILDVNSGQKIAEVVFTGDVGQIYDLAVIPNGDFAALCTSGDVLNQHLYDFVEE